MIVLDVSSGLRLKIRYDFARGLFVEAAFLVGDKLRRWVSVLVSYSTSNEKKISALEAYPNVRKSYKVICKCKMI